MNILSGLSLLSILLISSCQKDELQANLSEANNSNQNSKLIDGWIEPGQIKLMAPKKNIDKSTTPTIWGVGASNRVYRSDNGGTSWSEPNPSASLKQVSCGNNYGVWGVTPDGKIWKWNGSGWFQPNTAARAAQISAMTDTEAWVVTSTGTIYATTNGGSSWYSITSTVGSLKEVSAGCYLSVWGVNTANRIVYYNYANSQFEYATWTNLNYASHISAGPTTSELWALGTNYKIYTSYDDGATWSEPNTSAYAYEISRGHTYTYVIGNSNRIFKSSNGTSWSEPNPSAGLFKISAGWDEF